MTYDVLVLDGRLRQSLATVHSLGRCGLRVAALGTSTGQPALRLVREIGLEGYCQVEFRRGSAGKPYLMEVNPRLNLGIEVAVRAGVDFPYLLYQWATDQPVSS